MKVKGFWVYTHTTPDGMVYVGRSGQKYTSQRWKPINYKYGKFHLYIEKWGWENIKHKVIKEGLTKEESYKLEQKLILMYKERGISLNFQNSGGLCCDDKDKEYSLYYYQQNKEEIKKKGKEYYQHHKEDIKEYNKQHREERNEYIKNYCKQHRKERNEYLRKYRHRKKILCQLQPDGCLPLW